MYVLSWWTAYPLTPVLCWCLFHSVIDLCCRKSLLLFKSWETYHLLLHRAYIYIYIYIYMCVCVCVCIYELNFTKWNLLEPPQFNIVTAIELTHWGRVTHICVVELAIIDSDNGLSPGRRQPIIWTNAGILLIGPLGTNFREILIEILLFSFKKCVWKCRLRNGVHFVSALMF